MPLISHIMLSNIYDTGLLSTPRLVIKSDLESKSKSAIFALSDL